MKKQVISENEITVAVPPTSSIMRQQQHHKGNNMDTLETLQEIMSCYKKLDSIKALSEFDANSAIQWIKVARDYIAKTTVTDSRIAYLNREFEVVRDLDNAFHSCLLAINADDIKTVYMKFHFQSGFKCLFDIYTEAQH